MGENKKSKFVFSLYFLEGVKYIEKKEIIEKIVDCAKNYNKNLNNRNVMFIYLQDQKIKFLETKFTKANFLHLTGVKIVNRKMNAKSFYSKCIANRIKEDEIEEREDGNTKNKLSVLNNLMYIHKNARSIGDFNQNRIFLYSDKIIGSISACLGFIANGNYYICNTSLKEDIRKITCNRAKIVCIACKQIQDLKYNKITYIDERYREKIFSNKEINEKIKHNL